MTSEAATRLKGDENDGDEAKKIENEKSQGGLHP